MVDLCSEGCISWNIPWFFSAPTLALHRVLPDFCTLTVDHTLSDYLWLLLIFKILVVIYIENIFNHQRHWPGRPFDQSDIWGHAWAMAQWDRKRKLKKTQAVTRNLVEIWLDLEKLWNMATRYIEGSIMWSEQIHGWMHVLSMVTAYQTTATDHRIRESQLVATCEDLANLSNHLKYWGKRASDLQINWWSHL